MIENTSKNPQVGWLFGGSPQAIEAQEKQGQRQLVNTSKREVAKLPVEYNGEDMTTTELYESLGFEVIGQSIGDDLFMEVKMPEGWKVEPTNHSMWSNLVDPSGNIRTMIFYKAAFYDREAHIGRLKTRYTVSKKYFNRDYSIENTYERYNKEPIVFEVKDGEEVIFTTDKKFFTDKYNKDKHREWWDAHESFTSAQKQVAIDWLEEKYPDWADPYSYWE